MDLDEKKSVISKELEYALQLPFQFENGKNVRRETDEKI